MSMFPLNFTSDIQYLRNKNITEYDMVSGGYSITLSENLIEDEILLETLKKSDKYERQIILGKYSRDDKTYVKSLNEGFKKYISAFVHFNSISTKRVLSVKKDAIFIFDSKVSRTKFKSVIFSERGSYTSYLRLGRLEFYYDNKSKTKVVKGVSLSTFEGTLIDSIFTIMAMNEFQPKRVMEKYIEDLRQSYVTRTLVDSYYRELSPINSYKGNENLNLEGYSLYTDFPLDEESIFTEIDISYNYVNIIVPLCNIFL